MTQKEKSKASGNNQKLVENPRAEKGLLIAQKSFVRKIEPPTTSATLYKVKSENPKNDYQYSVVVHSNGEISCDCPDFLHRNATCKHIYAVVFSDQMGFTIIGRKKPEEEFSL